MSGVVFPEDGKPAEKRSTTATAKRILAAALAAGDAPRAEAGPCARAARRLLDEPGKQWRYGYRKHVAGCVASMARADDRAGALRMARAGLRAAHEAFFFRRGDEEVPLREAIRPGRFPGSFATAQSKTAPGADGGGPAVDPSVGVAKVILQDRDDVRLLRGCSCRHRKEKEIGHFRI